MSERVQLDHMLLDIGFNHKPKVIALRSRYGHIAALLLIEIQSTLSAATNAEMDIYAAYGIGPMFEIPLERSKEIVHYLVEQDMLQLRGEVLTQRRVAEDQEKLAKARKRKADNQKTYRDRHSDLPNSDNVTDNVTHSGAVTPVTDTVTEVLINSNKEESDPNYHWGPRKIVRFTQIDWEMFQSQNPPDVTKRAVELAEAHVDKLKGTADYQSQKDRALNGFAYCSGWPKVQAYKECAEMKVADNRVIKSTQTFQKPDEKKSLIKPFVAPKREEHTPEQRAANIQKLKDLQKTTVEKVSI